MLVLSRGEGERITIGDNVVVTVVKVRGGQVRIGVDAPKEVPVPRRELPPLQTGKTQQDIESRAA